MSAGNMSAQQLGPVISEHKGRLAAGGVSWYVVGLMFVASIVGAFKAVVAGDWNLILYFLVALPLLGGFLFWLYTRWKQTLILHTEGFEWKRIARANIVVRYDEIDKVHVRREVSRRAMHMKGEHTVLTVRLKSGKTVTITNDIENAEQLASYADSSKAAAAPGGSPPAASPWG